LVRRSRNRSRQHVIAGLGRCGDSWRELALSLGVFDTVEPVRLAERIAQGATGRVVIVAERHRTGWGKLVGERLETLTANVDFGILLIILRPDENDEIAPATLRSGTENHRSMPPAEGDPYDTTLRLDEIGSTDSRRWWEAVVVQEELLANPVDKLETLDTWWENVRQQPVDEQLPTPQLSRAGASFLATYSGPKSLSLPNKPQGSFHRRRSTSCRRKVCYSTRAHGSAREMISAHPTDLTAEKTAS